MYAPLGIQLILGLLLQRDEAAPRPAVRLSYSLGAGAERCPTEEALREAVAARLGRDPFGEDGDAIAVHVEREGKELVAVIEMGGGGRRRLASRATDCAELAAAIQLAVAITIDTLDLTRKPPTPQSPPEPELPPELPPEPPLAPPDEPRAFAFWGAIGGVAAVAAAPVPSAGFTATLQGRWERFSLDVGGRVDVPASSGHVATSLVVADVAPCVRYLQLGLCALVAAGAQEGQAVGLLNPQTVRKPYVGAGVRALAELELSQHLALHFHAELIGALAQTELLVDNAVVWTTPPLSVAAGLELAFRLW